MNREYKYKLERKIRVIDMYSTLIFSYPGDAQLETQCKLTIVGRYTGRGEPVGIQQMARNGSSSLGTAVLESGAPGLAT